MEKASENFCDPLALERLDDVVVVDPSVGELLEQPLRLLEAAFERRRDRCRGPGRRAALARASC